MEDGSSFINRSDKIPPTANNCAFLFHDETKINDGIQCARRGKMRSEPWVKRFQRRDLPEIFEE